MITNELEQAARNYANQQTKDMDFDSATEAVKYRWAVRHAFLAGAKAAVGNGVPAKEFYAAIPQTRV